MAGSGGTASFNSVGSIGHWLSKKKPLCPFGCAKGGFLFNGKDSYNRNAFSGAIAGMRRTSPPSARAADAPTLMVYGFTVKTES